MKIPREKLEEHHGYVSHDNTFQRRARLLQALWREEQGLPVGMHREKPLGSRLEMPRAMERLENYLTDGIRRVVRDEVLNPEKSRGKLYAKPRIFNDLLSSQPMCFNLFAELKPDLELATEVFQKHCPGRVRKITSIEFEWSPGRGRKKFTGDRSAFDVYVTYESGKNKKGFMGIEVKYHENLSGQPAVLIGRHERIARRSRVFDTACMPRLARMPLQQVYRDHLLALSMLQAEIGFNEGCFVFLYPRDNAYCSRAVEKYSSCLEKGEAEPTFEPWTLEGLVKSIKSVTKRKWIRRFEQRYLGWGKIL